MLIDENNWNQIVNIIYSITKIGFKKKKTKFSFDKHNNLAFMQNWKKIQKQDWAELCQAEGKIRIV